MKSHTNKTDMTFILLTLCSLCYGVIHFSTSTLQIASAFTLIRRNPTQLCTSTTAFMGFDLSGNTWKPDSDKMGSTDVGDYFPDGYNPDDGFSEGMMGSQAMLGNQRDGPELPGLKNLGADAVVRGGIEAATGIPAGMEFIPSSVPDGTHAMNVASSGSGTSITIQVKPVCMTFEDYFASFSNDSHPSLSVTPFTGRMDRRGGEITELVVTCDPKGQAGEFNGDLVINLPEDNSKICYKITALCF